MLIQEKIDIFFEIAKINDEKQKNYYKLLYSLKKKFSKIGYNLGLINAKHLNVSLEHFLRLIKH